MTRFGVETALGLPSPALLLRAPGVHKYVTMPCVYIKKHICVDMNMQFLYES